MKKKIPVITYSRVTGYYQPVEQFNKGKKQEFKDRVFLKPEEVIKSITKKRRKKK